MDDFFSTHSVYKTLVICDTEENGRRIRQQMVDEEHSVVYVTLPLSSFEEDDRHTCNYKFRQFALGEARVLVMTYATWYELVDRVEDYVMDHDLLILHGLETNEQNRLMAWLVDARKRGFLPRSENYQILFQESLQ